jgi:hypothetical protein
MRVGIQELVLKSFLATWLFMTCALLAAKTKGVV